MLEALDHPDMINLILHYLLGLPDAFSSDDASTKNPVAVARKRKSMDLLSMMAQTAESDNTPMLFNLVDMILACLRSRNQQTIHVTLQLVSTILKRHHRYAVITLLRTEPAHKESRRTIGAHKQEVEYFMSLAGVIGGLDHFDEIYDNMLKDSTTKVEGHPCSLKLVAPKVSTNNHKLPAIPDSLPGAPRDIQEHTLRPEDPLFNTLIDILSRFFVNPVETNLSVTETLVDLAVCGYMRIEGWFARDANKYIFDDDVDSPLSLQHTGPQLDENGELIDPAELVAQRAMQYCRRRPRWTPSTLPRLMNVLQFLADGVATYKETVPRFEDLLQQRREAFQTADAVLNQPQPALKPAPKSRIGTPVPSQSEESVLSGSPARPSALEGFAHRILSELGTPSRSGSPRGRRDHRVVETPDRGREVAPSGGYGLATPVAARPAPLKPHANQFLTNYDNARRSGQSYSPVGTVGTVNTSGMSEDVWSINDAAESQKAAFAAVDQSILNRRIGMPHIKKPEPIPLKLERAVNGSPVAGDGDGSRKDCATNTTSPTVGGEDRETETDEGSTVMIEEEEEQMEEKTVTVSHVITNVVILQSFLFELASVLQVRAGMFDEVRFV